MLQFETLLLRQLQKQQISDEFCDTVLHTQGVSVPVHSCVLSAFSPRFYGTLSSMPVPMAGQRRLIELQAVDACTLLNLVSLLYSGQLHENREQVLSAAQILGIELPQWEKEDRQGGKVGRRKLRDDADQETEVDAEDWDDRTARRTGKSSRKDKEKKRESATQTECGKKTDESGAQTDLICAKPQSIQTMYELGSCVNIQSDVPATHSEIKVITCDTSAVTHDIGDCLPVSESACLSQIYLYSLESSHHQTSTSVTLHPHNSILDQTMFVPAAEADAINDLKQFEGNIPGFINYFLDSTDSSNLGRMRPGCAKEDQVVKRARATARESGREWVRWTEGRRGGRRPRHTGRCGLVARLAWCGQGGGRVGRLLETRSSGKNQMKAFQKLQVREALVEAGKARGRGRPRKRGKAGTVTGSEKQNNPSCNRRPRGRPRLRPLPPASCSFSTTKQSTVGPIELDLLHTMTPVLDNEVEPIQPIDTLLEDIMTGLHLLPPAENQTNQHDQVCTTTSSGLPISKASYPNSHLVKPTDPKQHMEGEVGDILDHFLRTFDQQVGCCGLDVGGETSQGSSKADSLLTHQTQQGTYLHTSSPLRSQTHSMVNPSVAKSSNVQDGQERGSKVTKSYRDRNIVQEFETERLTRSQTMKRKLETALSSPQKPVKRKHKEKESADTKKKRQRADRDRPRSETCMNKSGVKKQDKSAASQVRRKESQKHLSAIERRKKENRFGKNKGSVKNRCGRMDGFNKRKKSLPQKRHGNQSNALKAAQSSARSQMERPCIAMEKVKMLFQLQDEEEDERVHENVGIHWEKNVGTGISVNQQSLSKAEERFPVENSLPGHSDKIPEPKNDKRVKVNSKVKGQERINVIAEVRPRHKDERRMTDRLRQEEMSTEERSVPLELPSNTDEEDDVDVVEVSSPTSELPVVSILAVDQSTEEEVEDFEIDVLGLEPDSPRRVASDNPGLHTLHGPAVI